jgi:asparagine synthase (glutamine-hydrolysing)
MCGIFCLVCPQDQDVSELIQQALLKLKSRGPDAQTCKSYNVANKSIYMGFTRLAIMDTTDAGMQPFETDGIVSITNGEIYNHEKLAAQWALEMQTKCDCEIISPLCTKVGFQKMISDQLDGEFATVVLDTKTKCLFAARDRYGVRPLYIGVDAERQRFGFASELKALTHIFPWIRQVKPSDYYKISLADDFVIPQSYTYFEYTDLSILEQKLKKSTVRSTLRSLLTLAVEKRLHADREIGFLLSGGLDSSLIVSIATKIIGADKIVCFSVGMEGSPDVEAAKEVVRYLGIKHHHIIPFTTEIGIKALPDVIKTIETYDVTTIRASTAQYVMAEYISKNTNVKVILSGEGSDEAAGSYRYFRDAPGPNTFHWESVRLLEELYKFDCQRTDRTMSDWGLEVRVPFLDFAYVDCITRIDPDLLMFKEGQMEKQILRDAFKSYLPDSILYRSKEAFSDAVSSESVNWAQTIKQLAETTISDLEFDVCTKYYTHNPPISKEALYYRRIFDHHYKGHDQVLDAYWLPKFQKVQVTDPSARVLQCY